MLQQTTVSTVVGRFEGFLQRFPTLKALSEASEEEVCVAWKGLGYYRRAFNLLKAARFMATHHGGRVPQTYGELIEIPGIGDYTASALLAMGRDQRALCLDANIERVTSRLFGLREERGPRLSRDIRERFEGREIYKDFHHHSPREANEALMDLGRVVCRAKSAHCLHCPLSSQCVSAKGDPLALPVISKGKGKFFKLDLIRCLVQKGGRVLVYKKGEDHWLSGQYELPTFVLRSEDSSLKQYPPWKGGEVKARFGLKSQITKYKITNHVVEMSEPLVRRLWRSGEALAYKRGGGQENLSGITFKILKGRAGK